MTDGDIPAHFGRRSFSHALHKMDIFSGDCYAGAETGALPLKTDQKIMAIASGGGHWVQLMRLRPAFDGPAAKAMDVFYVSMDPSAEVDVPTRRHYTIRDASRKQKWGFFVVLLQLLRILLKERPEVVIATESR